MSAGNEPDVSTLTKVWYATSLTGTRTQIAYTQEIPQLEEPPEQITAQALDIDYEIARPGIKKAGSIQIPILFTHTQHKTLRALKNQKLFFFFELPNNTAETANKPLVRYLEGTCVLTMDTIATEDFLKDILTIYKSSDVLESDGFPTASV